MLGAQGIGCARVTPCHVPGIFQKDGTAVFLLCLVSEHGSVEIAKLIFHVLRYFGIAGELDGAVVRRLDSPRPSQCIHIELLFAFGVQGAKPYRQHEFIAFVGDLNGTKIGVTKFRLLLEIYLGHEKAHVLFQVTTYYGSRAFRYLVAAFCKPGDQTIALFGGQNKNVVLANRVLCFNGYATAPGSQVHLLDRARQSRTLCRHVVRHWIAHAGIRVVVFDEARRRIGIQVVNQASLGDIDLSTFDKRRNGNDNGKIFDIALKVISHRYDGSVVVTNQHDLRRLVEKARIGPRDKEAAKGHGVGTESQCYGRGDCHD